MECTTSPHTHAPWNKGKLVGQKAPFKPQEVWAIRVRLQMESRARELALFDLGIDSKLRACDLVKLRVRDVCHGDRVASRATVMQQKTQRPVQFEITPSAREAVETWTRKAVLRPHETCSRAACTARPTWAPASTPASSMGGCRRSAWTRGATGPTRCGAPRLR